MLGFCGYSFLNGKDALNPVPSNVENIKQFRIENAVYDYVNIDKNTEEPMEQENILKVPVWDLDTILSCDFTDGTSAGNVNFTLSQLTSIKIKRRRKSKNNELYKWVTIKDIKINTIKDLDVVLRDYFVPSKDEFEYAVVPILNGIEGSYIIASVETNFDGLFISDINDTFKIEGNVSYDSVMSNQTVGQVLPLGKRYPVIIKNGEADYKSGSVTAMILGKNFSLNHEIIRRDIVEQTNKFLDFLKDGNPKFIRDWNGNIFLCRIFGNPTINYNNSYGMGINNVAFQWIEQGKYDNETDLIENGLIDKGTDVFDTISKTIG